MDLASGISIENAAPLAVGRMPSKGHKKHHRPQEDCQNCGARLAGEYCHECGQHGHVHRSVLHVIEEVFHGITHFDSRTWRSLPMLAFRPGTLTRHYGMGKRVRYVPPFAMFLFSIFAMFLAFAFSGGPGFVSKGEFEKANAMEASFEAVRERKADLDDANKEVASARQDLEKERRASQPDLIDIGVAQRELARTQGAQSEAQKRLDAATAALRTASDAAPPTAKAAAVTLPASKTNGVEVTVSSNAAPSFNGQTDPQKALVEIQAEKAKAQKAGDTTATAALTLAETAAKASIKAQPKVGKAKVGTPDGETGFMDMVKNSMRDGDFEINTPWPSLNEKIKHKFENPDLFIYKLQNTVYKFSFLLVPLSLPFLWLMLFWKRGVTLFDHAVFSLYSLSFVSFLFLFISVAAHWFEVGPMVGAAAIILPIHIFFQFKGAYALKWFSAFWRTCLFCGFFSWIVIGMFLVSIVVLGAAG